MSIWLDGIPSLDVANAFSARTMVETLSITFIDATEDSLTARMPVDERHVQPQRVLHGGASVVLAETVGSVAANLVVDTATHYCVGLDINANHLRGVREGGAVTATARPIHLGRSTQVWSIEIRDEASEALVCVSRLTMSVLAHR